MLATVAAADSASTVKKKYSVFIYSEAEPYAMYAIYKQTRKLCVLQYLSFSHICGTKCSNFFFTYKRINPKSLAKFSQA